MNFPFVKFFSSSSATALGLRAIPFAACLLWAAAASNPAYAQAAPAGPASAAAVPEVVAPAAPSAASAALTDETRDLPKLALNSQIMFQVLAAEMALQRGQPAPAYQTYLSLTRDTHDPRMAERAAEIALHAQSPADALVAARLWHQYAPNSKRAVQLDASLLVLSGNLDEAQPLLSAQLAAVSDSPADPHARDEAILALQTLIAQCPNRSGGLQSLQALLAGDLQRPTAQLAIARQQVLAGDETAAQASLQKALQIKPDFEPAAVMLAQLGPATRAASIETLNRFVAANPGSRNGHIALAQLYVNAGQFDAAQQQFEAIRKNSPDDPAPLMALAMLQVQQSHINEAKRDLEKYSDLAEKQHGSADPALGYLYLAQISVDEKDIPAALKWLNKIDQGSTQYLPAQVTRAQLLAKQGKLDEARKLLASLTPISPSDQLLVIRTDAALLEEAKLYAQAQDRYAEADRQFPQVPSLIYDYAMACEKNGQYPQMEKLLRHLIQIDPTNPNAYNALGYSLADRNQQIDEATKLVQKAVELAPNDAFIQDSLGWVKYRAGDKQDAVTVLRHAYEMQPNAEIGAHLGEVLWSLGQQDEARQAWRAALKVEPSNQTLLATLKRFQVEHP
jgi:tetratricopeptide (TPR) repeat protein